MTMNQGVRGWRVAAVGALVAAGLVASACKSDVEFACDETHSCLPRYPDRPFCDLTGQQPGSEGIRGTCVAAPMADAGGPDGTLVADASIGPDASVADGASSIDAPPGTPDAMMSMVDAAPGTPDATPPVDADMTPDAAPPPTVVQVALGAEHTCALISNGEVRCWGDGTFGQLGYGNTDTIGDNEPASTAGAVSLGAAATAITAGDYHSCALLIGGSVRCWGFNGSWGELGLGHTDRIGDNELPTSQTVINLNAPAVAITTGTAHSCALQGTTIRCWGEASSGRLGYGNENDIGDNEVPANVADVKVGGSIAQVSAGGAHSCATMTNGDVRCWGTGLYGRTGHANEDSIGDNELPSAASAIVLGASASEVYAGVWHSCARTGTAVRCWGRANRGQLGYANLNDIGDNENPSIAGTVNIGLTVDQLSVGKYHNCIRSQGKVRCWGYGANGRLGYQGTSNLGDAAAPFTAGDVNVGTTVTHVEAGPSHTCAITTVGQLRCWGSGSSGKLGYGNTDDIGDTETPASVGDVPLL